MDKPQYQIPTGGTTYRFMGYPPQRQPLQLLYPGRLMENWYHYTGSNIPNSDMDGAMITREQTSALSKAADMELEAMNKHLGGKHKVLRHPAVEPEALLEDPALRGLNLESLPPAVTNMQESDTSSPTYQETEASVNKIVNNVRQLGKDVGQTGEFPQGETKLPGYDWKSTGVAPPREYFGYTAEGIAEGSDGTDVASYGDLPSDKYPGEDLVSTHRDVVWVGVIVMVIVLLALMALLAYGLYKHHRNTEAMRPVIKPTVSLPRYRESFN